MIDAFVEHLMHQNQQPTKRGEGDEMNDHIMSLYPEWAFVIAPDDDVDFYALGAAERKKMLQGK